jgi:(p)ppGpp synthase/HD superfamily hydrolase
LIKIGRIEGGKNLYQPRLPVLKIKDDQEIFMAALEEAIALAVEVHKGQMDKSGQPYILHALRVMFRMSDEVEQIVGILHDVVEDSAMTFGDLRQMGFSEEVIEALDGVTRRDYETYSEFIARSQHHPISRRVKLADLEDNMDMRRLSGKVTKTDLKRLRRYRRAWGYLCDAEANAGGGKR